MACLPDLLSRPYLAHLLTDFVLQSDQMVARKKRGAVLAYRNMAPIHFLYAAHSWDLRFPASPRRAFTPHSRSDAGNLSIDWLKIRMVRSELLATAPPTFLSDQGPSRRDVFRLPG